jgi:hypothetical protein
MTRRNLLPIAWILGGIVAGFLVGALLGVGRSEPAAATPDDPAPTVTITAAPTVVEVPVEVEPAVCFDAIQIAYDGFAAFRAALHSTGDERASYLSTLDELRPQWQVAAQTCEEMTW